MALLGTTKIVADLTYTETSDPLTTPTQVAAVTISHEWAASTVDVLYANRVTLEASGGAQSYDLYGALTDRFGATINLATLRELIIYNRATTAGYDVKLAGNLLRHATSPIIDSWTDDTISIIIRAGGHFAIAAPVDGYAISAGAYDAFTLDPGANEIDVDIVVLGKA